ncbi:MAG: C25 family peptidase propeptide domain-containing protein, partial [bacterium]|nr:C25 family peptidase propeptide domain-containing protein [bacterium]
ILLLLPAYLLAGEIQQTVTFNKSDLSFKKLKGYDIVELDGCSFANKIGSPMLPQSVVRFVIPPSANVTKVEIVSKDSEILAGEYKIYPAQPPQPISFKGTPKWVEPDAAVYLQSTPYPTELIMHSHTGNMGGYRIASFLVYPVQYIPKDSKLIFNSRITFKITYKEGMNPILQKTLKEKELFGNIVKGLVINSEAVDRFAPLTRLSFVSMVLSQDTVEYVIITAGSFGSAF